MEKGKQSKSIIRQNLFEQYNVFANGEVGKNFVGMFHEKKYRIKDTDLTYRTINHWEQIKLINSKRENDNDWRKFSSLDLLWLNIISKLRELNLPLETIKSIKRSITLDLAGLHYFEFLMYLSIGLDEPLCLVAFPDGSATVATQKEFIRSVEGGMIEHQFIYINISELLNQTPRSPYLSILEKPILVTKDEAKIFKAIKDVQEKGDAKISFEIKNNKPVKLEVETMFQGPVKNSSIKEYMQQIGEHLKNVEYGSIVIQKQAGKIACHSVNEKTKLQEKPGLLKG